MIFFHPFPSSRVYTGYIWYHWHVGVTRRIILCISHHFSAFPFIPTGWCLLKVYESLLAQAARTCCAPPKLWRRQVCAENAWKCWRQNKTKSISHQFLQFKSGIDRVAMWCFSHFLFVHGACKLCNVNNVGHLSFAVGVWPMRMLRSRWGSEAIPTVLWLNLTNWGFAKLGWFELIWSYLKLIWSSFEYDHSGCKSIMKFPNQGTARKRAEMCRSSWSTLFL